MHMPRDTRRSSRAWRWGIALTVVAALLAAWWLALDTFATRLALDAENALRELPPRADLHPHSD